ncbi:hypothetical protein ACVWZW_006753 [Bradyrhizobium sp. F1.13.4]
MMTITPEVERAARHDQPDDEDDEGDRKRDVDDVTERQDDRGTAHARGQLQERDHRTGEGQRADGDAERHLDQALRMDVAGAADVEGFRRVERTGSDQHRGHTDQRMEGGDQFRHRGHRHATGDHRADAAADRDTKDHEDPGEAVRRRMAGERGGDRDRHTDHAKEIALPR